MKKAVIVGYGNMGSRYADMIYSGGIEGLSLYGILCRNRAGQEKIMAHMPGAVIFPDEESMFGHVADFDAVIITTPHREHVRVVAGAQRAGLHVLCEKPLGISAAEGAAVTGDRKQVCAMVFNWRAREIYRQVHALLEEQALGRLHTAVWTANFWFRPEYYHRLSSWRSTWKGEGGGLLINQCQHLLDMWNRLFGQPQEVYARIGYGRFCDIEVDDSVTLLFSHKDGMTGTLISSTGDSPGSNRLEIHGEYGKLVVENESGITIYRNQVSTAEVSRNAREPNPVIPFEEDCREILQERDEYAVILQNFADAMHGKTLPLASLSDGLKALETANAAYLSDWQGRRVSIPCRPEEYLRELRERQR